MVGTVYGSRIVADVTLRSLSPYSQSRAHDEPAYENESKADYDRRTWRSHLHVENGTVRIPAKAFHDCWIEAAEYSGKKITGNRTWTKPFTSGIAIFENPGSASSRKMCSTLMCIATPTVSAAVGQG